MNRLVLGSVALVAGAGSAIAADVALKVPPTAAVAYSGGVYIWADGSAQSVGLPTYDLGLRQSTAPPRTDLGPLQSFDPRATGYGVAGGVGYVAPDGVFPTALGSHVRAELGVSYVRASASQSGTKPVDAEVVASVGGIVFGPLVLIGVPASTINATLTTEFSAWQVNLKGASDYRFGRFTVTPSIAVFGGNARNDQALLQTESSGFISYQSNSSVKWIDAGARFGLDTKADLASWLTVGVGGHVGLAHRSVSMSANDVTFHNPLRATSISEDTTTIPFLANAEASVTVRPWPFVAVKAFAGLNYDSRVPGISAPSYVGPAVDFALGTPAGVKFAGETSYYGGGGLTVKFGP